MTIQRLVVGALGVIPTQSFTTGRHASQDPQVEKNKQEVTPFVDFT